MQNGAYEPYLKGPLLDEVDWGDVLGQSEPGSQLYMDGSQ